MTDKQKKQLELLKLLEEKTLEFGKAAYELWDNEENKEIEARCDKLHLEINAINEELENL